MLKYLNFGPRRYDTAPVPLMARANWEFEAVVRGRIAPTRAGESSPALQDRTLWVFPPGHRHGWTGARGRPAEIVVFHFGGVPRVLEGVVTARGGLAAPLDPGSALRLRVLARALRRHFQRPTPRSELVFDRALLDLSLLALSSVADRDLEERHDPAGVKVAAAMSHLAAHLEEHITLADVARAVRTSPRQLRRYFRRVYGRGPASVMREARIQHAVELMSSRARKLHAVARLCGFSDGATFSRAFRTVKGVSPAGWRKERRGW